MTEIIFDFDAIRRAMAPAEAVDVEITADDLEDGQTCPRFACEGVLEAGRDLELGCSCHIAPPCSGCCPGVLNCSACKEVFRYE